MSASTQFDPRSDAPFGTEPRRSNTPIYVWGTLYALGFCGLIWLAFFYRPG